MCNKSRVTKRNVIIICTISMLKDSMILIEGRDGKYLYSTGKYLYSTKKKEK